MNPIERFCTFVYGVVENLVGPHPVIAIPLTIAALAFIWIVSVFVWAVVASAWEALGARHDRQWARRRFHEQQQRNKSRDSGSRSGRKGRNMTFAEAAGAIFA